MDKSAKEKTVPLEVAKDFIEEIMTKIPAYAIATNEETLGKKLDEFLIILEEKAGFDVLAKLFEIQILPKNVKWFQSNVISEQKVLKKFQEEIEKDFYTYGEHRTTLTLVLKKISKLKIVSSEFMEPHKKIKKEEERKITEEVEKWFRIMIENIPAYAIAINKFLKQKFYQIIDIIDEKIGSDKVADYIRDAKWLESGDETEEWAAQFRLDISRKIVEKTKARVEKAKERLEALKKERAAIGKPETNKLLGQLANALSELR